MHEYCSYLYSVIVTEMSLCWLDNVFISVSILIIDQEDKGAQILLVPELVDFIMSSLDKVVLHSCKW